MLPSHEVLYANWRALGHVLVAGLPGGGTDVILTSLLAALTTRCRPHELHLWTGSVAAEWATKRAAPLAGVS